MESNILPISLRSIFLDPSFSREEIQKSFEEFKCELDEDVEAFLQKKALRYEELGKARTYLFYDRADMKTILGYFTISIMSIKLTDKTSMRLKEKFGYSDISFKYKEDFLPAYFLALFGKDEEKFGKYLKRKYGTDCKSIKNKERLSDIAIPYLRQLVGLSEVHVGGQAIYLDCEKSEQKPNLPKFYESIGFEAFDEYEITRKDGCVEKYIQFLQKVEPLKF